MYRSLGERHFVDVDESTLLLLCDLDASPSLFGKTLDPLFVCGLDSLDFAGELQLDLVRLVETPKPG